MNTTRKLFAAALLAGAMVGAQAQTTPSTASPPMSIPQIVEHITAKGYTDVREVERKSEKLYEIKARDAQGQWVELDVDSRSGEVLRTELKRKP